MKRPIACRGLLALVLNLKVVLMMSTAFGAESDSWAVYYGSQATFEEFSSYGLLIFDSDSHPPIAASLDAGQTLLGYLSLGEANHYRSYFAELKDHDLLLSENENWPGSYAIDVRDARWSKRVIETIIPSILRQGFHGIFLDTVDVPVHLERVDKQSYTGMAQATVALIQRIRRHFPHMIIALNRGYDILHEVAADVDIVLGESVYATYDFNRKEYHYVATDLYVYQVRLLRSLQERFPKLKILTLDYWNPDDAIGISNIYKLQRENGFAPYVTTIDLNRIVPEPRQ